MASGSAPETRPIGSVGVSSIEQDGAYFDNVRRIREMPEGDPLRLAGLCVIINEGDRTLPPDTAQRIEAAAHAARCPLQLIAERAGAHGPDPHFSEPLKNPAVLGPYLHFLARH
jgi:hypothetical protein